MKVSQGAIGEVKSLYSDFHVHAAGFFCLFNLASSLRCSPRSLKSLVAIFLNSSLDKSLAVSDWSAPVLTPPQLSYAAADAWASRAVLLEMRRSFRLESFPQELPISPRSLGLV